MVVVSVVVLVVELAYPPYPQTLDPSAYRPWTVVPVRTPAVPVPSGGAPSSTEAAAQLIGTCPLRALVLPGQEGPESPVPVIAAAIDPAVLINADRSARLDEDRRRSTRVAQHPAGRRLYSMPRERGTFWTCPRTKRLLYRQPCSSSAIQVCWSWRTDPRASQRPCGFGWSNRPYRGGRNSSGRNHRSPVILGRSLASSITYHSRIYYTSTLGNKPRPCEG
mmetsp:Transcript_14521/g.29355  ORF Transcript_14521/g.29355 Transcript_14521/m.29355 type:complete len:221 (+) Transcript_14521:408-1070(+)